MDELKEKLENLYDKAMERNDLELAFKIACELVGVETIMLENKNV